MGGNEAGSHLGEEVGRVGHASTRAMLAPLVCLEPEFLWRWYDGGGGSWGWGQWGGWERRCCAGYLRGRKEGRASGGARAMGWQLA